MSNWSLKLNSNKAELRRELLAERRMINSASRQQAAEQAAQILVTTEIFQSSQRIGCYLATENEFDCLPIIKKIWAAKKNCYLPRLISGGEPLLEFVEYQENALLQPNRYKILEPVEKENIPLNKLDLVIAPLVGFDLKGHRLGMGGGYYDWTFAAKTCCLLGLAYEVQQVAELPDEQWDVMLDGIITEKGVTLFKK